MKKKILIVQIRPEDEAADNELEAFIEFGDLDIADIHRVQLDRGPLPKINLDNYYAVVVGGGPLNVSDTKKSEMQIHLEKQLTLLLNEIITRDFPYLGACYGLGAMVNHLGGLVSKERYSEDVGAIDVQLTEEGKRDPLLSGLPSIFRALGGHKEACQSVPGDVKVLASSQDCPIQMVRLKNNIYATQFHPELDTKGIVLRINVYKNAGYFPPEEAQPLIDQVKSEKITVPTEIFSRFIAKYSN